MRVTIRVREIIGPERTIPTSIPAERVAALRLPKDTTRARYGAGCVIHRELMWEHPDGPQVREVVVQESMEEVEEMLAQARLDVAEAEAEARRGVETSISELAKVVQRASEKLDQLGELERIARAMENIAGEALAMRAGGAR